MEFVAMSRILQNCGCSCVTLCQIDSSFCKKFFFNFISFCESRSNCYV